MRVAQTQAAAATATVAAAAVAVVIVVAAAAADFSQSAAAAAGICCCWNLLPSLSKPRCDFQSKQKIFLFLPSVIWGPAWDMLSWDMLCQGQQIIGHSRNVFLSGRDATIVKLS